MHTDVRDEKGKILGILGIKSTLVSGTHQGRSSGSNSIVENSKSLEKMKKTG